MIRNSVIHTYAGRFEWDKGTDFQAYQVPANYVMSKNNPFVPAFYVEYQTYYTTNGDYVGNTRGGATRVDNNGVPINPSEYGLELRTVKVRINSYAKDSAKSYDPLQPMRDNYGEYQAGRTTAGFVQHEITALENLAFDYYKELEANALALGAELKTATTVDSIGVLMATFGAAAGGIGAIVSGVGWLVQSVSGKKRLTKEFQALVEKGQKGLAEIKALYAGYKPASESNFLIFLLLGLFGFIIYKRKKNV